MEATKVEIARKKAAGEKLTRTEEVVQAFEIYGFGCAACVGNGSKVNGVTIGTREE